MQTSNANQSFSSGDPGWVLLAELSVSDFLQDRDREEEPAAGLLFQTLRELEMSPECMENIARALAGFARGPSLRTKQGRLEFSRRVRIFCQKKRIEAANPAHLLRPSHTERDQGQKQIFPDPGVGGWGYFMIARVEVLPPDSSAIPHSCMDLYLYKEGE
jgi:hypothetical protein